MAWRATRSFLTLDLRERVYLPAAVAYKFLEKLEELLAADDFGLSRLTDVRCLLASLTGYVWFHRSDTDHQLLFDDMFVQAADSADPGIFLRERAFKGRKRRLKPRVLRIPLQAHRRLGAAITCFKQLKQTSGEFDQPHDFLWRLEGDHGVWAADLQNTWLAKALELVGERPPPGLAWTSHSLRSGAATASNAINVALTKICHFGGWAQHSGVVHHYIDPSAVPDEANHFFFGWLLGSV